MNPYDGLINKAANIKNVPNQILRAVLKQESGLNPNATATNTNGSIDRGIAQINNVAHPDVSNAQAYNPNYAIPWAANYLSNLKSKYGTWDAALQAYNSGSPTGSPRYAANVLKIAGMTAGTAAGTTAGATTGTAAGTTNWLEVGTIVFALVLIIIAITRI